MYWHSRYKNGKFTGWGIASRTVAQFTFHFELQLIFSYKFSKPMSLHFCKDISSHNLSSWLRIDIV